MDAHLAVVILSTIALAVSSFSAGYSMANWHFSSTFVRDKVIKKLEEELRWRLQLDREMNEIKKDANEIINDANESKKDATAK